MEAQQWKTTLKSESICENHWETIWRFHRKVMLDFVYGVLGSYRSQFYGQLGCGFLWHERVLLYNMNGAHRYLEFLPLAELFHAVSITSSNVQSNTTCLTNIFIDLGLHVSIHYGIIIRPSLKYTDPLHKTIKTRFGIRTRIPKRD